MPRHKAAAPTLGRLNRWVSTIGSAVYTMPPGCAAGGYVGDRLLAAAGVR